MGESTNETWQDQKFGFYYTVVNAMLKTGFTEEEIGKIGGGNFAGYLMQLSLVTSVMLTLI